MILIWLDSYFPFRLQMLCRYWVTNSFSFLSNPVNHIAIAPATMATAIVIKKRYVPVRVCVISMATNSMTIVGIAICPNTCLQKCRISTFPILCNSGRRRNAVNSSTPTQQYITHCGDHCMRRQYHAPNKVNNLNVQNMSEQFFIFPIA